MKKVIKGLVIVIVSILVVIVIYIGVQFIQLRLYIKNEKVSVPELTALEKEEDFMFLTKYVRDCYPYGTAVEKYKGLDNIITLEKEYIKRAGETKDNLEFLNLFIEYSQRLGQAGHWGLQWLGTDDYSIWNSYIFGIPKDAFGKTDYWFKLASKLPLYVHTDINLKYSNGEYILSEEYTLNNILLPKDTVIVKVNDMVVDEYVKTLQSKQLLRFDGIKNKVFTDKLFMSNPGENVDGWSVEFALPNNNRYKGIVKKINGYYTPYSSKNATDSNVICKEFNEQTGYIKIASFLQEYIVDDNVTIQNFLKDSNGKYHKLIIDVRGNIGGEPVSWMNNIIQPLLKQSVRFNQVTAVKKSYFSRMNLRYIYYTLSTSNNLLNRNINHISAIDKVDYEGLNNKEWTVYNITKELTPQNSLPFDGQLYVLADNDTLSAADTFLSTVKAIKLGKVVGTNSIGWGNIFMQPNICAMPNSGLMLRMDVEMPFNSDGTVNSVYGTMPDVNLAPSTYPTPFPISYDINTLLKDPWINWVMNN